MSQIAKFMGPTWGPPGSSRHQMGPMLVPWTLLSGVLRASSSLRRWRQLLPSSGASYIHRTTKKHKLHKMDPCMSANYTLKQYDLLMANNWVAIIGNCGNKPYMYDHAAAIRIIQCLKHHCERVLGLYVTGAATLYLLTHLIHKLDYYKAFISGTPQRRFYISGTISRERHVKTILFTYM